MPKKKKKRDHSLSSGFRARRSANRIIMRLKMKINRWKRYQKEIGLGQRTGELSRWDFTGIEKHINLLKGIYGII